MEHTKGELTIMEFDAVRIDIDPHNNIVMFGENSEANAAHLVLCWNAHASLQAKADLHDEVVFACGFAKAQIKKGAQKKALPILRQALAKAKKLTGEQT